jgi:Ca-activated chloride channel homolog
MWGEVSVLAHIVRDSVGAFILDRGRVDGTKLTGEFASIGVSLKLFWSLADDSFVQRSAIIAGLSLALGGVTLAGIGEWATSRVDGTASDRGASIARAGGSRSSAGAAIPAPLPDLPDTSDRIPASSPGYSFHRDVPEVRLQFTVADERGRLVNDLTSGDVRVFDNQSPVAHFNEFERDDNLPLQLGLLLDTSDSVKRVLPQEKRAAIDFLGQVMRPQTDNAFVIAFGGDYKIWQGSTPDRQQLVEAISRSTEPGWGTRVFDALYAACSGQASSGDNDKSLHRVIIVLSDGDDTDSLHTLADVIAIAQRSEIQIYPLTIHSRKVFTRGDRILQLLADSTGGQMNVAPSEKDLAAVFAEIERDLRTQYYISFPPQQSTPGYHSLRVEVKNSKRLEVHARRGYYALEQ